MNAEDIKKLVEQKAAIDPRLRSIVRRMESGTATFKETSEYSRIFSEIVGDTLSEHVLSLEEREAVANELLRYGYENINSILARVQTDIDRKNRVNIRPQKASFPQERAEQFSHSLTDPTVPDETIERRANNGTANITMSFHDDYMRENAEFRSNAGLRCYIDRQTNGKCCTWCSDIAGRYDYGNEPQDVYRRHDNCDCTVTYENGRQRQDVWSKRSWEVPKNGLKYMKPTVISREKARELEQRNLAQIQGINFNSSSIDNSSENGIIKTENTVPATQQEIREFENTLRELGFENVTGFENYTESNKHLLEIVEDFSRLKADFPDYFKELKLDFGVIEGMTDDDYAAYYPKTGTIYLNPVFYNNFNSLIEVYNSDVRSHHHPDGTDYRATIYHEFGHRVQHISDSKPKRIAKEVFEKINNSYYTRKLCDLWLSSGLSKYAKYFDYDELIAESFAEYYCSQQPREICTEIMKYFLK